MSGIVFGPLPASALVVCIDMQLLFLEPGEWHCPGGLKILPKVCDLVSAHPDRTIFTRFITARIPDEATGRWAHYYRRWRSVTRAEIGDEALNLQSDLALHAATERTFDKATHDAFDAATFAAFVSEAQPGALILCGIETEVCVLATALSAVDLGIRTVIATDAVASSVPAAHRAAIDLVYPRFDQQIELATVDDILAAWDVA
jgi:nicotinamidase-related amidase